MLTWSKVDESSLHVASACHGVPQLFFPSCSFESGDSVGCISTASQKAQNNGPAVKDSSLVVEKINREMKNDHPLAPK